MKLFHKLICRLGLHTWTYGGKRYSMTEPAEECYLCAHCKKWKWV